MSRIALLCLLALAGCAAADDNAEPVPSTERRIVTIGGPVTEAMYALGLGDEVVGTDRSSLYPEAIERQAAARLLPPDVGRGRAVAAPDASCSRSRERDRRACSTRSGRPACRSSCGANRPTSQGAEARIGRIGAHLGRGRRRPTRSWRRCAPRSAAAQRSAVEGAAGVVRLRPRRARRARVRNRQRGRRRPAPRLAPRTSSPGYEGFRPMTAEAVAQAAPDVIVVPADGLESLGGVDGAAGAVRASRRRRPARTAASSPSMTRSCSGSDRASGRVCGRSPTRARSRRASPEHVEVDAALSIAEARTEAPASPFEVAAARRVRRARLVPGALVVALVARRTRVGRRRAPSGCGPGRWSACSPAALGLELSSPAFAATAQEAAVLLAIRLPRVLLSVVAGMGLAVSGALMQGLFRNPLADPGLVGVSSGAALGAAGAIVLGATVGGAGRRPRSSPGARSRAGWARRSSCTASRRGAGGRR